MSVPRIVVGNFPCEDTFAREAGLNPRVITKRVVHSVSAQATLLRALAEEGDLLWTPLPVDPARMADLPGLARPTLVSGPLEELPPAEVVLAWGETRDVQLLRERIGAGPDPRFPAAPAEVVAKVNHRSFLFTAGVESWPLPGSKMLTCVPELEHYLHEMAAPPERWVLKAPWSAAGRLRYVGSGARIPQDDRRHVIDLFYRFDELLFEPWLPRVADFGVSGIVDGPGGTGGYGVRRHRQFVDGYGRFRSLRIREADPDLPDGLGSGAGAARAALEAAGYRGPFGIDAFNWTGPEGATVLRAVSEVNARLTFGHLAHALRDRLFPGAPLTLHLGDPPEEGRYVPLLHPGETDPTQAGLAIDDGP